jgi:small subunit ribosomal protein S20
MTLRVAEAPPVTRSRAGKVCGPVANIKSQIKRIGTNEKSRLRNKAAKSEVRTRIKSAVHAAGAGEVTAAEDLRLAVKRLDKAAARGIIHRNQAANRKSALMRRVAELAAVTGAGGAVPQEPEEQEE